MRNNYLITGQDPGELECLLNMMPRQTRRTIGGIKLGSVAVVAKQKGLNDIFDYNRICSESGVPFYIGGGIADAAMSSGRTYKLVKLLQRAGINTIEISNPPNLTPFQFREVAKQIRRDFETVLVEVGEKNNTQYPFDWWAERVLNAENIGADRIVLEGAVSGNVGIYDRLGNPNTELVRSIRYMVSNQADIIIEATAPRHQRTWIDMFGPDVKLGNIFSGTEDINISENLRRSARDTSLSP